MIGILTTLIVLQAITLILVSGYFLWFSVRAMEVVRLVRLHEKWIVDHERYTIYNESADEMERNDADNQDPYDEDIWHADPA